MLHNRTQRRKSWYFLFFQIPFLPEWRMRKDNWRIGARALQGNNRKIILSGADISRYHEAWSQPGAAKGMFNWYRASLRRRPQRVPSQRVTVPTLLIWGAKDRFLCRELAQPSIDLCDEGKLVFIEEASHWVQHEEPARVNELLLEFF
jgi:pimeloyl-ACP methyl ester carboxylesterase